jgi:hypothetical protein
MGRDSPNRVHEHRLGGIYCRFEYYWRKKDVRVIPDEDELRAADAWAVLYCWTAVANWAVRFHAANPGWTVNGAYPNETLDDS